MPFSQQTALEPSESRLPGLHVTSSTSKWSLSVITPDVRDHPDQFKVLAIKNDVDLSHHGWTVDEPEDLVFVRRIFDALYREGECFGMPDVLAFLDTEGIG